MEMMALASRTQEMMRSCHAAIGRNDAGEAIRLLVKMYDKQERIKVIGREARQGSYQAIGFPLNEEE
jgi:hypothetical protein